MAKSPLNSKMSVPLANEPHHLEHYLDLYSGFRQFSVAAKSLMM